MSVAWLTNSLARHPRLRNEIAKDTAPNLHNRVLVLDILVESAPRLRRQLARLWKLDSGQPPGAVVPMHREVGVAVALHVDAVTVLHLIKMVEGWDLNVDCVTGATGLGFFFNGGE